MLVLVPLAPIGNSPFRRSFFVHLQCVVVRRNKNWPCAAEKNCVAGALGKKIVRYTVLCGKKEEHNPNFAWWCWNSLEQGPTTQERSSKWKCSSTATFFMAQHGAEKKHAIRREAPRHKFAVRRDAPQQSQDVCPGAPRKIKFCAVQNSLWHTK